VKIYGVDFTCAPRAAKPITVAAGSLRGNVLRLEAIERLPSFAEFETFLQRPGPWVGGFDFPFGLPEELVRDLGWPLEWRALVRHCAGLSRAALRETLDAYRAARPAGNKYARRRTELPAGCSSAMKLVNPPVALMFHEGARRIAASGAHVPALAQGDPGRVVLEAYPGLLARAVTRASYKNDARAKQTPARAAARRAILASVESAAPPRGVQLQCASRALRRQLLQDASGDALDAVLCALQAAWGAKRSGFGLPQGLSPCEGWIVSAQPVLTSLPAPPARAGSPSSACRSSRAGTLP
jgi:hypothetical protein